MIEEARKGLKRKGFENIYETAAGATITSHCGEHTLGILYLGGGVRKMSESVWNLFYNRKSDAFGR